MKKVSNLLLSKGNTLHRIGSHCTVYEALERMVANNVGSLLVYEGDKFVGIITERSYARKVILKGKSSKEASVGEIMEQNCPTVQLNDSVEHCMHLMTNNRLRYLPVLADGHVIGIVAMTDVVRFIMEEQQNTIQNLQSYITGAM